MNITITHFICLTPKKHCEVCLWFFSVWSTTHACLALARSMEVLWVCPFFLVRPRICVWMGIVHTTPPIWWWQTHGYALVRCTQILPVLWQDWELVCIHRCSIKDTGSLSQVLNQCEGAVNYAPYHWLPSDPLSSTESETQQEWYQLDKNVINCKYQLQFCNL